MTSSPLRRYLYISAFRLDELVGQIIRTDGPVTGRSLQLLGVASSYQKANPDERAMFHRNIAAVEDYLTATGQRGMSTPRRSTFRGGCRCSCPFEGVSGPRYARSVWRMSVQAPHVMPVRWPMPDPETLALAAAFDRLRCRRPRWWLQVDELSRWAAEREQARAETVRQPEGS